MTIYGFNLEAQNVFLNGLIGKTIKEASADDRELTLKFDNMNVSLYREQDCCEFVYIESIDGDLQDLVDSPLLMAEVVTNNDNPVGEYYESFTWTFYKFATVKGYVTIRFYGESNGYYSESVDILVNEKVGKYE